MVCLDLHKFGKTVDVAPDEVWRKSAAPLRSSAERRKRCSMRTADEWRGVRGEVLREGSGVRSSAKYLTRDCIQQKRQLVDDVVIGEPDDTYAVCLQCCCACGIASPSRRPFMYAAVDLDCQLRLGAVEVDDVAGNRMLTAET